MFREEVADLLEVLLEGGRPLQQDVIAARQLDEMRAWDLPRDVSPFVKRRDPVRLAVQNQGRHVQLPGKFRSHRSLHSLARV